jgi:hypothetical protein
VLDGLSPKRELAALDPTGVTDDTYAQEVRLLRSLADIDLIVKRLTEQARNA